MMMMIRRSTRNTTRQPIQRWLAGGTTVRTSCTPLYSSFQTRCKAFTANTVLFQQQQMKTSDELLKGLPTIELDKMKRIVDDAYTLLTLAAEMYEKRDFKECMIKASRAIDTLNVADITLDQDAIPTHDKEDISVQIGYYRSRVLTLRASSNMNMSNQNKDQIEADLKQAVTDDENNSDAHYIFGSYLLTINRIQPAIIYLSYAVEKDPKPEHFLKRAEAYTMLGDSMEKEDVRTIVQDTSTAITSGLNENPIAYLLRGKAILRSCQGLFYKEAEPVDGIMYSIDQALSDLTKAIKLGKRNADAYFDRAMCYAYKTDYLKALEDLDLALLKAKDEQMSQSIQATIEYIKRRYSQQRQALRNKRKEQPKP